jgi:octaprenyl-diphosphate synthase
MDRLDHYLHEQLATFEPEIREMVDYCIDTSGKRIRPALVFFSGMNAAETFSDELVRVAAVVELVHLATLVHDDIMDGAVLRRNRRTAARVYGAEASVLLGDALFSHALNLATQFPSTEVCAAVSDSMRKVCAGEIVQTMRRGTTGISRADYRRVIDLKTAELFRLSCFLGSRIGGYAMEFVHAAARYGRHLGIAYQIYDDLADFFGEEKRIGKTLGTDLASGKLTLPLIELLECLPSEDRASLQEEITKTRPPQLAVRIAQMHALEIFPRVVEAIGAELREGEKALSPYTNHPPSPLLLSLSNVLQVQIEALRRPTTANNAA